MIYREKHGSNTDYTFHRLYSGSMLQQNRRVMSIGSHTFHNKVELETANNNACLNKCVLIVRGKDRERQAWHLGIVFEHQLEEFWAAIHSRHLDVSAYCR